MSKLAKKPVKISEGVNVAFESGIIKISGTKGALSFTVPAGIDVKNVEGNLTISAKDKSSGNLNPFLGLTRSMLANMVMGVSKGFEKQLELSGVGYKAQVSGNDLIISVGFSHPVKITGISGLSFAVKENIITVSGMDKEMVGNMAARIRSIKPPEPYKGKGIKYVKEKLRRKVGKTAKALGTK